MTTVWIVVLALGLLGPAYAYLLAVIGMARSDPTRPSGSTEDLHLIVLVPCLNEGDVVEHTIGRLTAADDELRVVVIDDASDDATPDLLAPMQSRRVLVTRRELPDARVGKGAALNHAFEMIRNAAAAQQVAPENVIVGVLDADGHLDPDALEQVLPWFLDPSVGAVQVLVRINDRSGSLLSRMQDVEFGAFIRVLQRGRNHITSTGLGGNGQFTRLVALEQLGPRAWADTLTEDLDLGIRLRLDGWRTIYDQSVAVHQQGLHSLRPLLRQRTRWFQGHLQAWMLFPQVWKARIPKRSKADISFQLVLPVLVLLLSVAIAASFIRLGSILIDDPSSVFGGLSDSRAPWWYLVAFIATPLVAITYYQIEGSIGVWRILLYAHLYSVYTWVWFFAGWRAVWRQFRGSTSWAKTPRNAPVELESASGRVAGSPVALPMGMTSHLASQESQTAS